MNTACQKLAVVTGAGGAIGKAIAECLTLQRNCHVCALDVNSDAVHEVVRGIVEQGGHATAYVSDLSDEEALKQSCRAIVSDHGDVAILVNNAAVGAIHPAEAYPEASWRSIMALNLTAPFLLSKQFVPGMRKSAWGRIVNISSINGLRAGSGRLAYGTSKTAIVGLTRQFAIEIAPWGITVNAVAPGAIMTPMLDAMTAMGQTTKERLLDFVPMNRFGLPEEVATAVSFFASDESAYITGQTLAVDGGFAAAGILLKEQS